MRVVLEKMDGVESADVSLKQASADIFLKPGNRISLTQVREVLKKSGYPTKDAQVTAKGKFVERGGTPAFDLLNGVVIEVIVDPALRDDAEVEVRGVSRVEGKGPERLTVTSVKR